MQQPARQETAQGLVVTPEDVLLQVNGADLQPGAPPQLLRLVEFLKQTLIERSGSKGTPTA